MIRLKECYPYPACHQMAASQPDCLGCWYAFPVLHNQEDQGLSSDHCPPGHLLHRQHFWMHIHQLQSYSKWVATLQHLHVHQSVCCNPGSTSRMSSRVVPPIHRDATAARCYHMSAPFLSVHNCPLLVHRSLTTLLYRVSVTGWPCRVIGGNTLLLHYPHALHAASAICRSRDLGGPRA
jgi:hypothetical protein